MKLSLGQAAKETGKSKSTISKAVKSGRLSAIRNDQGGWDIDPSELFRVYNRVNPETVEETSLGARQETPEETPDDKVLKAELKFLHEQVTSLKEDRDHWRDQAKSATALLTHDRAEKQTAQAPQKTTGREFRIFGWRISRR